MKGILKNPHPIDMIEYYSGMTFVVGGRDFKQEEKASIKTNGRFLNEGQEVKELDWSFLKQDSSKSSRFRWPRRNSK